MPAWAWILLIALSWPVAAWFASLRLGRRLRRANEQLPDREQPSYPPPYSRGGRW